MASQSALINVTKRRQPPAAACSATSAGSRICRSAARVRRISSTVPTSMPRRPSARSCRRRGRAGDPARGGRRHRGQRAGRAGLGRRSARRHHQLPSRHSSLRDLDRGDADAQGRKTITAGSVFDPVEKVLLRRKGQGRVSERTPSSRLGPSQHGRLAVRLRHPVP